MVLTPLVSTHAFSAQNLHTPLRKRRRSADLSEAKGTWLLHDPRLERHAHPHRRHAECPERIRVIFAALERAGLAARCRVIACRDEASDEVLGLVHSCHYLQRLKTLRRADGARLQAEAEQFDDVFLNEHSIACARLAADGVVRMAEALWAGSMHNGLALVRPAGHHAGKFGPSGFCLLNSVAVAARRLLAQGCQRVLIVDWDVHHGDGTQQAFLDEGRVLTFSVHRRGRGVFPFGGMKASGPEAVGEGKGAGRTVNLAWDQARVMPLFTPPTPPPPHPQPPPTPMALPCPSHACPTCAPHPCPPPMPPHPVCTPCACASRTRVHPAPRVHPVCTPCAPRACLCSRG